MTVHAIIYFVSGQFFVWSLYTTRQGAEAALTKNLKWLNNTDPTIITYVVED